ncbi:MAG: ABC transporter permease [Clostridia bacterium]|nr:ABC transporter permease [Clostridia bacterium]MBQ7010413.1 ABC transporter permease [Clostridia bacterium]
MENNYTHIPQEKFAFAQKDAVIHDTKFDTKARGYFADALIRFKKNKSSVAAAYIILFLVIFSIVSPIISPYSVYDKDNVFINHPPFNPTVAEWNIGILDGAVTRDSLNEVAIARLKAIGEETGLEVYLRNIGVDETEMLIRGKKTIRKTYKVEVNKYYEQGIIEKTISYEEFEKIQAWQNESGVQVIFPAIDLDKVYPDATAEDLRYVSLDPNIWYQCSDTKNTPVYDADGNFIPAYVTDASKAGAEYNSIRIKGDDGSYVYSIGKSGSVSVRICYYNYYRYLKNGEQPNYFFGTDQYGRDLFCAIGVGARFSLVFAVLVSAINLTIGAVYGSIQGYYGGMIDMILDRISDILSGVPFTVVAILFKLHLAEKVGVVASFLFAFVMTGWIGMAALTRKQFYRFKGQEYILAAKTLGASDKRLMFKHIFPNSLGTIITSCVLVIPGVINSETSLTYLGIINLSELFGTSIGELMSLGQETMKDAPHAMLFPALFISLLLISFNLFGNGLRDAFNPSTRGVDD